MNGSIEGMSAIGWELINVGDFVKEKGCHTGFNEEWQSYDVDEDKVRSRIPTGTLILINS